MKRIPIEDARHMLANDYEYYYLEADDDVVIEEWRKLIGDAAGLVEVEGELFLVVDDDCSFGLEEYPDADESDVVRTDQ
jgi:hypothetical protein